jgi:replicative DNA helicase
MQPGWLGIVGGRLGTGKTWIMAKMACEAAIAGFSVLFYSLEQSRHEIAMRTHTLLSAKLYDEVFRSSDLQRGYGLDIDAYQEFLKSLEETLPGRLVINDASRGRVTPMTVAAAVEREEPDLVLIDYLTLMGMKGDGGWQSVGDLSSSLKQLALRYEVPIIVGSQLNRNAIREDSPDPGTLSRSDSVGHDADMIVTITKKSKQVRKMSLIKFRHGMDGQQWFCSWKPNIGGIDEITGDEASDLMEQDKLVD